MKVRREWDNDIVRNLECDAILTNIIKILKIKYFKVEKMNWVYKKKKKIRDHTGN